MLFSLMLNLLTILAILALLDMVVNGITGKGIFQRVYDFNQLMQETKYNRNKRSKER